MCTNAPLALVLSLALALNSALSCVMCVRFVHKLATKHTTYNTPTDRPRKAFACTCVTHAYTHKLGRLWTEHKHTHTHTFPSVAHSPRYSFVFAFIFCFGYILGVVVV